MEGKRPKETPRTSFVEGVPGGRLTRDPEARLRPGRCRRGRQEPGSRGARETRHSEARGKAASPVLGPQGLCWPAHPALSTHRPQSPAAGGARAADVQNARLGRVSGPVGSVPQEQRASLVPWPMPPREFEGACHRTYAVSREPPGVSLTQTTSTSAVGSQSLSTGSGSQSLHWFVFS